MLHLIMKLESPAMSFGGVSIDNIWNTDQFPGAALLTGLLGNAMGWDYRQTRLLQRLQDRLIFAARIDREPATGTALTDFQTVQLDQNTRGWTTYGRPEGRAGSPRTYISPNLRYRKYFADMSSMVALRLSGRAMQDSQGPVTLERLGAALQYPARPLFIGRKAFIPSDGIFAGFAEGETVLAALISVPTSAANSDGAETQRLRLTWPPGEGCPDIRPTRTQEAADIKNWDLYTHGGRRTVHVGSALIPCEPAPEQTQEQER